MGTHTNNQTVVISILCPFEDESSINCSINCTKQLKWAKMCIHFSIFIKYFLIKIYTTLVDLDFHYESNNEKKPLSIYKTCVWK